MNQNNKFDIKLLKIDDIKFVNAAINNDTAISTLNKEEEITVDCSMESGVSISSNKIRTLFHCNLCVKHNKQITATFTLAYIFSVEKLQEYIDTSNAEVIKIVNSELMNSLASITYSTSRGIIYSRTLGTIFNNVILPVTSTNELLKN